MIYFHIILHPAVHIYDFHIFITMSSSFHGFINEQIQWPVPSWLVSSILVEDCTRIAEVKGLNPIQAWIFFLLSFCKCKSCVYNYDDLLSPSLLMIYSSLRSSHIWFSYIRDFMIILSRVYNEAIQQPASSWLVRSIDRALHRYRKGQAFESIPANFFFRLSFRNCKSCVYNCNDLLSYNAIN